MRGRGFCLQTILSFVVKTAVIISVLCPLLGTSSLHFRPLSPSSGLAVQTQLELSFSELPSV